MAQPKEEKKRMKAIVCSDKYGSPKEVLKLMDLAIPKLKPNEILIEIYSVALNPVDYKMVKGWLSLVLRKKFPWIVGRDFAGCVCEIGAKVDRKILKQKGIEIGTFVCGMIDHMRNDGTFCEYICITPEYCQRFEANKINLNEAASIPLAGMTSYQAILRKGNFKKNDKILILGGSSGCGCLAIQIAKIYGASEITVTSSQEAFCKSLGADIVLNYKDETVPIWYEKLKDKNYDIIFDCVGGKGSWDNAHKILKKNASFVTIVGDEKHGKETTIGGVLGHGASIINRKFWSLWSNPNYSNFLMDPVDGLDDLLKAVYDKKLKPILDDTSPYTLENFMEMFEKQMSHTAHGKLVLQFKKYEHDDGKDDVKEDVEDKVNDNDNDNDNDNNNNDNNDNNNDNDNDNDKVENNESKEKKENEVDEEEAVKDDNNAKDANNEEQT